MAWDQKEITAYLVDVDTGDYLDFQYNPNDIVDEKSTAYAAIKIPGMSHPRYQYVAGEPRKIGFKLVFFKGSVKESVDWLRSLLYPEHAGTMLKNAPHRSPKAPLSARPQRASTFSAQGKTMTSRAQTACRTIITRCAAAARTSRRHREVTMGVKRIKAKEECRYRPKSSDVAYCGICKWYVPDMSVEFFLDKNAEHRCKLIGYGGKGYRINHNYKCDNFKYRESTTP